MLNLRLSEGNKYAGAGGIEMGGGNIHGVCGMGLFWGAGAT